MTRTNIRALIRKRLGETTASFWTDAELNTWINDAGHDIVYRTKCLKDNGYVSSVASTSDYTLSTNFPNLLAVTEVYFNVEGDTWEKLEPTTRTQLDIERPGWLSYDEGTPDEYYADKEEDVLVLIPTPSSSNVGTDYIRVYYADGFTELSDDTSSPACPEYLHEAFVDYVCAKGFEQRGYGEKGNDAWAKYYNRIASYLVERQREKEDDDIVMKGYKNI